MSTAHFAILHVGAAFLLTAFTFKACATAADGKDKKMLMITGMLGLLVLVGGFGLLARLELGFPGWVFAKLGAWLIVTASSALAYRLPDKAGAIGAVTLLALLTAVVSVYAKPF